MVLWWTLDCHFAYSWKKMGWLFLLLCCTLGNHSITICYHVKQHCFELNYLSFLTFLVLILQEPILCLAMDGHYRFIGEWICDFSMRFPVKCSVLSSMCICAPRHLHIRVTPIFNNNLQQLGTNSFAKTTCLNFFK